MTWIRYLGNDKPLTSIYTDAPSLTDVRLLELTLHQDGPTLTLRIDLNSYPDKPPRRWAAQRFNRVQLELMLLGLSGCSIRGWGVDNIGNIVIAREEGLRLSFVGRATQVDCRMEFIEVKRVSAYHDVTLSK